MTANTDIRSRPGTLVQDTLPNISKVRVHSTAAQRNIPAEALLIPSLDSSTATHGAAPPYAICIANHTRGRTVLAVQDSAPSAITRIFPIVERPDINRFLVAREVILVVDGRSIFVAACTDSRERPDTPTNGWCKKCPISQNLLP